MGRNDSYVLMKDHKPTFYREHQARLINPSKNPIGKIAKYVLDNILKKCRECLNVNQLRSTQDAILWFNKIEEKDRKLLLKADIAN